MRKVCGLFLLLLILISCQTRQASTPTTTVAEIVIAYQENVINAKLKYENKLFLVKGNLGSIEQQAGDSNIYLLFDSFAGDTFAVLAKMNPEEKLKVAKLKKGDELTMLCLVGMPMEAGERQAVQLNDCKLQ
jgi:hypothetical protein